MKRATIKIYDSNLWDRLKIRFNWWLLKHGIIKSPYPKWMYQMTEQAGKALEEAGKEIMRKIVLELGLFTRNQSTK